MTPLIHDVILPNDQSLFVGIVQKNNCGCYAFFHYRIQYIYKNGCVNIIPVCAIPISKGVIAN